MTFFVNFDFKKTKIVGNFEQLLFGSLHFDLTLLTPN